jgi:cytochrome c-type biogenesis protein CcmH/NrfG
VLKLKPRDARAAYGLGNVYSDQQRWDDAEAAYRNSVAWAPTDADAHIALSVVLVQPSAGGDNAKRLG